MGIKSILERNPIIPAIKDNITLDKALNSNSELVFIILSNIMNIKDYTDKLKKVNKKVYIHIDMIDGLNSTNNGIDYIVNTVKPDGILTTKSNVVAHAYKNNINVIQRFFILDSLSYEKALLNIKDYTDKLKKLNKKVYIHVDMIDGLNSTNNGIDYIVNTVKPDGILTTKSNVVAHAYKNNINVIQRFFILDSLSYEKALLNIKENKVVAVEIMPGLMPKIIKKLSQETHIPIITGGLIKEKEDVINAINAGALSVSTTEVKLWED